MEKFSLAVFLLFVSGSFGSITFDGLKSSFAQYESWRLTSSSSSVSGKLYFQFKTHAKDSLLLYQDDITSKDYFSIELVDGQILATFGTARKVVKLEIGRGLVDMSWHILVVELNGNRATLTLDKALTKTVHNLPRNNGLLNPSSYLYIGGLPRSLSLSSLSWASAAFKKGFVGCIKKIMVTKSTKRLERTVLIKSEGTKSGCLNECRVRNPCLNNGKCINRFFKAKCNCTGTGFEGHRCEKEIIQVHLRKYDYIVYDMSSSPAATKSDTIRLKFRTSKKNALLLSTSFADDYVTIKLARGLVVVEWNLGSGQLTMTVPNKVNDGQWHEVVVMRAKRVVTASIDGGDNTQMLTPARHSTFNMHGGEGKVYIGGDGSSGKQFQGCLRSVVFNGVELISRLKSKDPRLTVNGKVQWNCIETPTTQPMTTHPRTTPPIPTDSRARNWEVIKRTRPSTRKQPHLTKKLPIPTSQHRKTMADCSPNEVRCNLVTFPPRPKPTQRKYVTLKKYPKKPTTKIDAPTDGVHNTTTTSRPQVEALKVPGELGNLPTALGLVAGSIVLFIICGIISVKLKKRRDRKAHAHRITIETREVDEIIDSQVYKADARDNRS